MTRSNHITRGHRSLSKTRVDLDGVFNPNLPRPPRQSEPCLEPSEPQKESNPAHVARIGILDNVACGNFFVLDDPFI